MGEDTFENVDQIGLNESDFCHFDLFQGVRKAHYTLEGSADEFLEKVKGKQLPGRYTQLEKLEMRQRYV